MEDKNSKNEKVEKNGNSEISRTKIQKVYVEKTKESEKTTRGGRFGIRER